MKNKNILLNIITVSLFFGLINNASTQVAQQDSLALVALYDSTNGESWTDNTNWLTEQFVSDWVGITVTNNRITAVNLGNNNLTGTIPPSICDLDSLESLGLFGNQLRDSIPSDIGSLKNLESLSLVSNELSGNIPPEIGNLTNLYLLNLSANQLSGPIPTEIGNLTNLNYLYLAQNQLTGSFPVEICNLADLNHLRLSDNQFNGPIPVEIGNLTKLSLLTINNNEFSGNIPTVIEDLKFLFRLNFSTNLFTGEIPSEICNLTNLEELYLRDNQLTGSIPVEIDSLINLTDLDLSNNQLNDIIPSAIGNLTNLNGLNLSNNQLSGTIPSELCYLNNLYLLDLRSNQLTGSIPADIGNLSVLTRLYLGDNQLTGSIPSELGDLINLANLNLYGNNLTGAVPAQILNLIQLEFCYLSHNQLADLPDLTALAFLYNLEIQNNRFTFEDIEPNVGVPSGSFTYSPQDSIGIRKDSTLDVGENLTISVTVGGTTNQYQWMKNEVDIAGANSSSYIIDSIDSTDVGSYICKITNTIAPDLILISRPFNLTVPGVSRITEYSSQIPTTYTLDQNYPNPFNPHTVIGYQLPVFCKVKLSIYNMLGQSIKTLVDQNQAGGKYQVQWNGTNEQGKAVSSGVYLYRLETDSFIQVRKMILIQ